MMNQGREGAEAEAVSFSNTFKDKLLSKFESHVGRGRETWQ